VDSLDAIIVKHEGIRLKPYTDTTGNITIGIGRNLSTNGISKSEAFSLLDNDITNCEIQLSNYFWYSNLDTVRQGVLIELVFNVGMTKVLSFKNMIDALKIYDYESASKELLDSLWAKQVGPTRSNNMADRLLTGEYNE
jgi:lysozyme